MVNNSIEYQTIFKTLLEIKKIDRIIASHKFSPIKYSSDSILPSILYQFNLKSENEGPNKIQNG